MSLRRCLLGLDPGFASFGWALLELGADDRADRVLRVGVIRTQKSTKKRNVRSTDDNVRRIREITDALVELLVTHEPVAIAAESFQHGKFKHTAVVVALAWGALAAVARCSSDVPLLQCSPQEMKQVIAGAANADKDTVAQALRVRYGRRRVDEVLDAAALPEGELEHAYDALGAATACLDTDVVRMARRMSA